MAFLLKLTKDGEVSTRLAATAVEALVLMRVYAANGYSRVEAFDPAGDCEVTAAELMARVLQPAG